MPHVIAERDGVIVLDKPAGLISHRDGRNDEPSVSAWLGEQFPECRGVGGDWVSPQGEAIALNGLVHRLDKNTSGILLAAKTQDTFDALRLAFKERRITKTYRALVYGHVAEDTGTIVAEIMRTKEVPRRWAAQPCTLDDVRAAITEWRVLSRTGAGEDAATVLELTPKTGRTHQLRVHLSSIGHSIVGDALYAAGRAPIHGVTRLALHAYSITVPLETDETFVAPILEDLRALAV